MNDYLNFRKMITPVIIQILFWLLTGVTVLSGLMMMGQSFLQGIAIVILGPVIVRIYCELVILFFRMNESLTDIRNNTRP